MLAFALAFLLAPPETALTAEEIMARVAKNQDAAEEARARYVYKQDVLARLMKGGGKLAREEKREYTVTPAPKGVTKTLARFEGRYEKGGKIYPYDKPGYQYKDTDIDGDLIDDLVDDLVNDKKSKDGLETDLFPLRASKLGKYNFTLLESKPYRGRAAQRIGFEPRDKKDFDWKGEAWIDAEEYQPVVVTSQFSRGLPAAVKILLGTNIKQLGFTIEYTRVAPGVWFPVSFGTEFYVRAVFFYARTITMALKSSDFRATDVTSAISYERSCEKPAPRPAP
jgi:hypothetical protein